MNYKRLEGEDLNTYALRLYENKHEYGLNSQDIADILNKETGKNYDESKYRKHYASFRKGIEYAKANSVDSIEELKALEEKKREIIAERDRLSLVQREYKKNIRSDGRQEFFYTQIAENIKTLEVPDFEIIDTYSYKDKDCILTIADIHAGAKFDIGKNKYSFDVITERFEYLLSETVAYCKRENLNHLNILCLSDTVQGILRKSDLKLNESSVVAAVVFIAKTISNFLNALSKYVVIDYYHCPTGNHTQTRNLGSDRNELKDEDVEYIIGNYINDTLADNPRVDVYNNFGKDYITFDCMGSSIIAMHGHTITNISTAIKDISFHNRKFYDILFLAHYHSGQSVVNGASEDKDVETYVVPSFIGTCPYSDSLMKASNPACMIYTLTNNQGVTDTHKILLTPNLINSM